MIIIAGFDKDEALSSSSNAAGIESGPNTALAGAIERISARVRASALLNKSMI
jgi:hypothetical protein